MVLNKLPFWRRVLPGLCFSGSRVYGWVTRCASTVFSPTTKRERKATQSSDLAEPPTKRGLNKSRGGTEMYQMARAARASYLACMHGIVQQWIDLLEPERSGRWVPTLLLLSVPICPSHEECDLIVLLLLWIIAVICLDKEWVWPFFPKSRDQQPDFKSIVLGY